MRFVIIDLYLSREETNHQMDLSSDWDIIVIGDPSVDELELHKKIYEDYPYMEAVKGKVVSFKNIFRLRDVPDPIEDIFERLEYYII